MKVRPSVKKMCEKCKIIRRNGRIMVITAAVLCQHVVQAAQKRQAID